MIAIGLGIGLGLWFSGWAFGNGLRRGLATLALAVMEKNKEDANA